MFCDGPFSPQHFLSMMFVLKENTTFNSKSFISLHHLVMNPVYWSIWKHKWIPDSIYRHKMLCVSPASIKDAQFALSWERTVSQNGCRVRETGIYLQWESAIYWLINSCPICVTWLTMVTYRTLISCLVAVIKWHTSMCDVCKHGHICVMEVGLNKRPVRGSEVLVQRPVWHLTFKYSSSLCHITSHQHHQRKISVICAPLDARLPACITAWMNHAYYSFIAFSVFEMVLLCVLFTYTYVIKWCNFEFHHHCSLVIAVNWDFLAWERSRKCLCWMLIFWR